MDVRLGFENDDRYYTIPFSILAKYPMSPIYVYSTEPSCEKPDVYVIEGISYNEFCSGHDYIMNHRRANVTKKVKRILDHYGFWDDDLEIYEQYNKKKLRTLKEVLIGGKRMILVENKEIYDEIRAFTSKPNYSYIVPVKIHMMDAKFSYLSIELCQGDHKADLPVYPFNMFSGSDFRSVAVKELAKFLPSLQEKTIPEGLCDMTTLVLLIFSWMVKRLKIEKFSIHHPEVERIMKCFMDDVVSSKDSFLLTSAIKEILSKTVNCGVYYGFYLAPNANSYQSCH